MHGANTGDNPFLVFLSGRGGPRRPYSPQSLRIVRLIVGLDVFAALLWAAIGLH